MSTIKELQKRTRAEQAALNKARATRMENKVAKYLKGNRVAMSGSGSFKGDCWIPYDEHRSIYVECKFTEKEAKLVPITWLEKIEKDTKSMRCVFGILVVSFHRTREQDMIVLVPVNADKYLKLDTTTNLYLSPIKSINVLPIWKEQKRIIDVQSLEPYLALTLGEFRECLVASQEGQRDTNETYPNTRTRADNSELRELPVS